MRWLTILRWLLVGLFPLCLAAWGWSYVRSEGMAWIRPDLTALEATIWRGKLYVIAGAAHDFGPPPPRWLRLERANADAVEWAQEHFDGVSFLGFGWSYGSGAVLIAWYARVPLWFPSLIAGIAAWAAWPRQRVLGPRGAFPVEVKGRADRR